MAIYAGETVRVYSEADNWDNTPMTPANGAISVVSIIDADQRLLDEPQEMTWVPAEARWLYEWDSPPVAGSYTLTVTVTTDDGISIDLRKVRLEGPRNAGVAIGYGAANLIDIFEANL